MRAWTLRLTVAVALTAGSPPSSSDSVGVALASGGGQPAAGAIATASDQMLTADGVTLRYREAGSGDPVMFVHGYSATLESQIPLANALASTHRVVALDVRGFGKSSKFAEPERFGQLIVDDVVRLMDHLKIARGHLVGHSMGALISANVAARYPARVSSVTLIAGPFYRDKPTFSKETARWVADLEGGQGLTNFMLWLFPKMEPAVATGASAQALKVNDLPSLIAVMRTLPDLTIAGLSAPGVPAVVAVGTGDPLHPLSVTFANASPGAKLLEIEGADHVNVAANPDVMRAMRELIQRTTVTSGVRREAA